MGFLLGFWIALDSGGFSKGGGCLVNCRRREKGAVLRGEKGPKFFLAPTLGGGGGGGLWVCLFWGA